MGDDEGVFSETAERGMDMRSSSDLAAAVADHLVVMVHGILGSTSDWKFAAEMYIQTLPDKVLVHCSECNLCSLTLDGVDVMGERLADEVIKVINRKKGLQKISFIAHSVGGLVARYAIGRLYMPYQRKSPENICDVEGDRNIRGTIHGLEAMNFITVATPHLGSRGNKQVPFLFGVPAFEKVAACVIHLIFRRTGRHLFLTDSDLGKPPLLLRMLGDCGDLCFMSALRVFRRRVAYSNACYDRPKLRTGPWAENAQVRLSASAPRRHLGARREKYEWEASLSEKYPHIVHEEFSEEIYLDKKEQLLIVDSDPDAIEEAIVKGLSQVSWEKVDVSFEKSRQRFAAHSVIQVKEQPVHSEGADVIQHMIDHFLT